MALAARYRSGRDSLAPALMKMFGHLLLPEWKTIEVIDNTEGTVHGTTADALRDQNRCHEGPTIHFPTAPGQEPPPLTSFVSLWAGHSVGDECMADVRWVGAELFNFLPSTDDAVPGAASLLKASSHSRFMLQSSN
jgi:hypothetical protein